MLGYTGKSVAVYGLGKSGVTAARALAEDGAKVLLLDDRTIEELKADPAILHLTEQHFITLPETSANIDWSEIEVMFKSPGINWSTPIVKAAQAAGVVIKGDVDLLYRRNPNAQFIGVTGTNGKSTTTSLIGHILKKSGFDVAVGGNIGDAVMNLPEGKDVYVIEMSSYQLELTQEIIFNKALILNLTPDHLDRHGDMENYMWVKSRIFERQGEDDLKVIMLDNEILKNFASHQPKATKVSAWSSDGEIFIGKEGQLSVRDGNVVRVVAMMREYPNLPGRHNWQNVAAAYGVLRGMISDEQFVEGVSTFRALPHRMEQVYVTDEIICVNDSKATNPESAIHALNSFSNIYWILGGMAKDEGIKPCLDQLRNVRAAFTIGECGNEFADALEGNVETIRCGDMETAVREAHAMIQREGLDHARLVLSPACASWDQFNSFEHRGDVFSNLCREVFGQ